MGKRANRNKEKFGAVPGTYQSKCYLNVFYGIKIIVCLEDCFVRKFFSQNFEIPDNIVYFRNDLKQESI
jgi:hypothetical protein